jgi:ubiquinone/menaquinone biosynthesis C-methylase UbiE
MDDVALYNIRRWRALVEANAVFTRPLRDMTHEDALERLNADGSLGDLSQKRVLALGGGGGRQSVLYGLCNADITILDISDAQLDIDREMATHYGFDVRLIQGDMRDLSQFEDAAFDIVDHPYSLNFIPEIGDLFKQIARVMSKDGIYQVMFSNPFSVGVRMTEWNGTGYVVSQPYKDGQQVTYADEDWVYDKSQHEVDLVVEYRHTLSTIINKLAASGFVIQQLQEVGALVRDDSAVGGTWEHLTATLPPWIWLRAIYRG